MGWVPSIPTISNRSASLQAVRGPTSEAPEAPSPFLSDSFTDTGGTTLQLHTGETGATWTLHGSYVTAAVISSLSRARATSTSAHYASGTPATADYDVEGVVHVVALTSGVQASVAGRIATGADTMYVARYVVDLGAWSIIKLLAGVSTSLGSFSQTLVVGNDYPVKLELRTNSQKLYVAGVERVAATDTDITAAGRAGVRFAGNSANGTGIHIDSIAATDA